jgi:hypothetical protein
MRIEKKKALNSFINEDMYNKKMVISISFNQISKKDTLIAGGKGASLGEMTQAGIPVPEGFVILSNTFDRFIEGTNLNSSIDAALNEVDIKKVHTVENASEKIKAMILSKEIPSNIEKEILKDYNNLNCKFVAVRSSATSEDSAAAAWAGQLDSFLNTTKEMLLENVKRCWASLFTPRAIFYRFEKKLNKDAISVAVVVQKMVDSEESGIAFSVHPITQDRNQIIIEAGFGLGESIVSGSVTPDSYVIDKKGFNILDININEQTKGLYKKTNGGNEWMELGEKGKKQVLNEKEIIELAKLILRIENHYGFPCDIEWAKEKGKFYIVQSRPITTLTEKMNSKKDSKFKVIAKDFNSFYFRNYIWIRGINKARTILPFFSRDSDSVAAIEGFNGDINYLINPQKWKRMHEEFTNKLDKNFDLLVRIIDETNDYSEKVNLKAKKLFEKGFAKRTNKELMEDLYKMMQWQEKIYAYGVLLPLLDLGDHAFLEDMVKKILKIKLKKEEINEEFQIVSYPNQKTFAFQQEESLLKLAQKFYMKKNLKEIISNNPPEKIIEVMKIKFNKEYSLLKKYTVNNCWVYYSFIGPAYTEETFLNIIKEELIENNPPNKKLKRILNDRNKNIKQKEKLLKKLNLTNKERKVLNLTGKFVWAKPTRKDYQSQLYFYMIEGILSEVIKRTGVERKVILSCPFKDLEGILDGKKQNLEKFKSIFSNHLLIPSKIGPKLYYGEGLKKIRGIIEAEKIDVDSVDIIKGSTAMKGFGRGKVKIINKPEDMGKMKKGDILVSVATTPV